MALNCATDVYVGKEVAVEFALACGNIDPGTLSFLPIGAMRGKEVTFEADTVDTTTDDSLGSIRSSLVTFKSFSFSGDGVCKRADGTLSNQTALFKHFASEDQPVCYMRFTYPDVTIVSFMILTNMSRSAPHDDVSTFSLEATASAADFPLTVTDTPVV